MSDNVFKKIAKTKILRFKDAFSNESKEYFYTKEGLLHPGEFGIYREGVVKDFLKNFLPADKEIGSGFIINCIDEKPSSQCDVVIYDRIHTPIITDDKKQIFYPIETVCGVGEIKSTLDKRALIAAIAKLEAIKKFRTSIKTRRLSCDLKIQNCPIDFETSIYDQLFTFLVCSKLDCNLSLLEGEIFSGVDPKYRPNLILSIKDGVFGYTVPEDKVFFYYPHVKGKDLPVSKISNANDDHLYLFGAYIFAAIISTTVFFPDLVHYLFSTDRIKDV